MIRYSYFFILLTCLALLATNDPENNVEENNKNTELSSPEDTRMHSINQKLNMAYNQDPLDLKLIENIKTNAPKDILSIVNTLRNTSIRQYWPHFILLVGEPGVGKSTLAKFIAQSLNWPYLFISAATIADEYQHSGAQNIDRILSEVFKAAENGPFIIIFDEINALTDKGGRKHFVDASTSMALWTWLDRCQKEKNIVVIGTTNTLEKQRDQIGSRAGCHIIEIESPQDEKYAYDLLCTHLESQKMRTSRISLREVANNIKDLSPRAIEQIVCKAVQRANDRNAQSPVILIEDLNNAIKDYEKSQNVKRSLFLKIKPYLKKFNRYIVPLLGGLASLIALIHFWPQLKLTLMQLNLTPKQYQIAKEGLQCQKESLNHQKLQTVLSFIGILR